VARVHIAVVIPALDEADAIGAAVESAKIEHGAWHRPGLHEPGSHQSKPDCLDLHVEIVVIDGGSRDRTVDRARAAGASVLSSSPGRARQLETGWRATRGDVVLFLHADTRLPSGWAIAVRDALRDPGVAAGAFRLRFAERSLGLAAIEWGAERRARWGGLPYGDQALFARRRALEAIGGIAPVPIAEDLDLVRALAGQGRLALLPEAVTTSARRYLRGGVFRTWLRHTLGLAGWRLGVDRDRLARWVRS
jgi:rSAM/selenodomain-associated transferase 2